MMGHKTKILDGKEEIGEFKCPDCGCDMVEEILGGATVTSWLISVDEDGDVEYADHMVNDGGVERYQCMNCGWTIKDEFGEYIKQPDELYEYLKQTFGKEGKGA